MLEKIVIDLETLKRVLFMKDLNLDNIGQIK
jgi:hypothetical protein